MDDVSFLEQDSLDAREWKALLEVDYKAPSDPVILADINVGIVIIERLVAKGLVTKGPPTPPYAARGYDCAYTLSPLGLRVKERGRYALNGRLK